MLEAIVIIFLQGDPNKTPVSELCDAEQSFEYESTCQWRANQLALMFMPYAMQGGFQVEPVCRLKKGYQGA